MILSRSKVMICALRWSKGGGSSPKKSFWAYLWDLFVEGTGAFCRTTNFRSVQNVFHPYRYLGKIIPKKWTKPAIFVQISWNLHQKTAAREITKLMRLLRKFWKSATLWNFSRFWPLNIHLGPNIRLKIAK